MTSPRVSVVIPTKDRSPLLRRAVASVLNQTFDDLEVIIVDDGSADDSAQQVAAGDRRISYIRHESSMGPCAARNTGIRLARGRYVAFLDDDDEWLPEKLERQVRILDDSQPDVGVAYTGFEGREIGGRHRIVHATAGGDVYGLLFGDTRAPHVAIPSMLVKKHCFDEVGVFDEALGYGEGWDMFVRLARHYRFAPVPDPLVVLWRDGHGISGDVERVIAGRRHLIRKYRAEIEAHPRFDSRLHVTLGVLELRRGNIRQARKDLTRAISACPLNARAVAYFMLAFQPQVVQNGCLSVWQRVRPLLRRIVAERCPGEVVTG